MAAPRSLPPAPSYSTGLEFTVSMLLRSMPPVTKLALARRMIEVFRFVEAQTLEDLASADRADRDVP